MNRLLEKGVIFDLPCGTNFSYVLNDSNMFLSTEYKVLQSQTNSCFVNCMKMTYNGKVQLFYLIKSLKSFASMIPTLDDEGFLTIVSNLISDIIDVKHNGFLSCQNIDISFDRIYVDPTNYKVSLVYLPVSNRIYDDNTTFENEIRTGLVRLISGVSSLSSRRTMQLAYDLSNGLLTMEELGARLKGNKIAEPKPKAPVARTARLVSINAPVQVEITVSKDSFLIGKNAAVVDGVISFNRMISRTHCRIDHAGGQYTITDMQSANGTYVNKVKILPNQPYPIKNGDIVRLANSDFQIIVG